MRLILCLCFAIVTVYGRPEAGYSYPVPNHSFSSASSGLLSGGSTIHNGHHYASGGLSSSYSLGLLSGGHSSSGSSFDYSIGGGSSGGSSISSSSSGSSGYTLINGRPTVHKHVYVHVAPPDSEQLTVRKPIHIPGPQKHYKIVFIKAPTAPTPTAAVLPQVPQNEEKTLIYVLHKNPDDQPDIVVPTPAPTAPSKPEVYFIKYKTRKELGATGLDASSSAGGSLLGGATLTGFDDGSLSNLGAGGIGHSISTGSDISGGGGTAFGSIDDTKYGPPGLIPGKPHH